MEKRITFGPSVSALGVKTTRPEASNRERKASGRTTFSMASASPSPVMSTCAASVEDAIASMRAIRCFGSRQSQTVSGPANSGRGTPPSSSSSPMSGRIVTSEGVSVLSCVSTSKLRMESTSVSKKSMRYGAGHA